MNKTAKKLTLLLLSLLLIGALALTSCGKKRNPGAGDDGDNSSGITYTRATDQNGNKLDYYEAYADMNATDVKDVVVLATYEGLPVKISSLSIPSAESITFAEGTKEIPPLYNMLSLKTIKIPSSVIWIRNNFSQMTSIEKVYISDLAAWCNIRFGADFETNNGVEYNYSPLLNGADLYLNDQLLTELTIPASVTDIKNDAFYGCESITSVTIGAHVESIGSQAFMNCTGIKSVRVENSGTTIITEEYRGHAFQGCQNVETAYGPAGIFTNDLCKSVKTAEITAGEFNNASFSGSTKLESITIGGEMKSVPVSFFRECTSLTTVKLPDTLEKIENCAFYGCSVLEEFSIPQTVNEIGSEAFTNCKALKSISLPDAIKKIGVNTFKGCEAIEEITIPALVEEIEDTAFEACKSLKKITLLGNTILDPRVFQDCSLLSEVEFMGSGDYKYSGIFVDRFATCAIESIKMPAKMACYLDFDLSPKKLTITTGDINGYIKNAYFTEELCLGKDVTISSEHAFDALTPTARVTVDPENATLASTDGALYEKSAMRLLHASIPENGAVTIPDGIEILSNALFAYNRYLKSVTLPESLRIIEDSAFESCEQLATVTWSGNIESIGDYAFKNCYSLTSSLEGLNKLESIGDYSFTRCVLLVKVVFGESITDVGSGAFSYCDSLSELEVVKAPDRFTSDIFEGSANVSVSLLYENYKNGLYMGTTFMGPTSTDVEYIIIREGTEKIVDNALDGCNKLRFVYIPQSINTLSQIGTDAFVCDAPDTFILFAESGNLNNIPVGTFEGIIDSATGETGDISHLIINDVYISDNGYVYTTRYDGCEIWAYFGDERDVVIPSEIDGHTVRSIVGYAFANTDIDSVSIPGTVNTIGGYKSYKKFISGIQRHIYHIYSVFRNSTVKNVSFADPGTLSQLTVNEATFYNTESLETVEFGENFIATIATNSFYGCTALETVTLPAYAAVYTSAFSGGTTLTNLIYEHETAYVTDMEYRFDFVTATPSITVHSRNEMDQAIKEDPGQLATYVLDNPEMSFEFGSALFGDISQ